MMGMFAGDMLRGKSLTQTRKTICLAVAGLAALVAGLLVSIGCPIIKNLWTPSYSLVVGGCSFLMLALFYWIIDVKGWRRWCVFLEVVGAPVFSSFALKSA